MKSFYVAASSSPEGVSAARALASRLEGLGMRCLMRWWECLGAPESEWPHLAARDVDAAVDCGLFVLLADVPSYGACVELGARLATGGIAHVLGSGHALFTCHPLVKRVESVDVLLAVLAGEGGGGVSVNDEQARCVHCGEVYDKAEQEKQRRDRCPACKRGHPADSYARLCGSEWCRCLS